MSKWNIYKVILLALGFFVLVSCEEVIEIDLNSANPVLVAEGYMDRDSLCILRLEYTTDFFNAEEAVKETGARVTLSGPDGRSEELLHSGDGLYTGRVLRGLEYGEYGLEVELGGMVYSGTSNLMQAPDLLKVEVEDFYFASSYGDDELPKMLTMSFGKVEGQGNYLMMKLSLNGESLDEPFALASDEFFSGDTLRYTTVVYPPPVTGDTLELEFFSVDQDAFRYYYQVSEAMSGGMAMSSTPYNPASNLGEEILGYFMARSRTDTVIYLK